MKNKLCGLGAVFNFSFKNATKGKGYKLLTAIVSFIIIGLITFLIVIGAKPKKAELINIVDTNMIQISPITNVYVIDRTNHHLVDSLTLLQTNPNFSQIKFVVDSDLSKESAIEKSYEDAASFVLEITFESGKYNTLVSLPENTRLSDGEINLFTSQFHIAYQTALIDTLGIDESLIQEFYKPIQVHDDLSIMQETDTSNDSNSIKQLIMVIVPMVFGLILYLLLLLYGSNITKSVSIEKTSKLVETLLTSVHPYALIIGKILANSTAALLQFGIWLISVFIGIFAGTIISDKLYPSYSHTVKDIITYFQSNIGDSAFSPISIILCILFFFSGFLFFSFICGLAGSFASKPEDAAASQAYMQLPIIFGFLASYLSLLMDKQDILSLLRFIPFTSVFQVPAEVLIGSVSIVEGLIMFLVLNIFTALIAILSGKLYKGLILYYGQKVNLKLLGNILKTK